MALMILIIGAIIAIAIIIATKERDPKLPKEVIRRLERPMRKKVNRRKSRD